jgi:hypothetical protein
VGNSVALGGLAAVGNSGGAQSIAFGGISETFGLVMSSTICL